MLFSEFLSLVKVLKMLYGSHIATAFFEKNIALFYDLDDTEFSASLLKKRKLGDY